MAGRITRNLVVRELTQMRDSIDRLLVATKRGALDPCDCGHSNIEHGMVRDPASAACGYYPCLVAGCDCIDFDDSAQQITELRRKTRLAEQEVARLQHQLRDEEREAA